MSTKRSGNKQNKSFGGKKKQFYQILLKGNTGVGIFYRSKEVSSDFGADAKPVENWENAVFYLRDGVYAPYMFSNVGARFVNKELKELIEEFLPPDYPLDFYPILIKSEEYGDQTYYLYHFRIIFDVIDEKHSAWVGTGKYRSITIPWLVYDKVKELDFFIIKGSIFGIVSDKLKREMRRRKLDTRIEFSKRRYVDVRESKLRLFWKQFRFSLPANHLGKKKQQDSVAKQNKSFGGKKKQFYGILPKDKDGIGVFYRSKEVNSDFGADVKPVENWENAVFYLRDGVYAPYMFSNVDARFVNKELKELIEEFLPPDYPLDFYPIPVKSEEYGDQIYYLFHFRIIFDVIDEKHSAWVGTGKYRSITIPWLVYEKVKELDFFIIKGSLFGIVSDKLKREMRRRKLDAGLEFNKKRYVDVRESNLRLFWKQFRFSLPATLLGKKKQQDSVAKQNKSSGGKKKEFYAIELDICRGVGNFYAPDLMYDFGKFVKPVRNWENVVFYLENGGYAPYMRSNVLASFVSKELKELIEEMITPGFPLDFYPIQIKSEKYGDQIYYLFHFKVVFDVIDKKNSEWVGVGKHRSISKPWIVYDKAKEMDFFYCKEASYGIVSDKLMKEMYERKLNTGLEFWKIPYVE